MTGKTSRDKGMRGQREAEMLLLSRDWTVEPLANGRSHEDLVGTDPFDKRWSIEVKHRAVINLSDMTRQAKAQAAERGMPWMLMVRLPGYPGRFLVIRQDDDPAVWRLG